METVTQDPEAAVDPDGEVYDPTADDDFDGEPEAAAEPDEDLPVGELELEGSGQLSFNVGGKTPTSAEVKLQGGSVKLEGQFAKGERVRLYVEAVVGEVSFVDTRDNATGQVVSTTRRHKARIVAVERA